MLAVNQAAAVDSVNLLVLIGSGDFYSVGIEIGSFLTATDEIYATLRAMIRAFPKLLICVINGPCIGIAAITAALCDIIYAVDTAIHN